MIDQCTKRFGLVLLKKMAGIGDDGMRLTRCALNARYELLFTAASHWIFIAKTCEHWAVKRLQHSPCGNIFGH